MKQDQGFQDQGFQDQGSQNQSFHGPPRHRKLTRE